MFLVDSLGTVAYVRKNSDASKLCFIPCLQTTECPQNQIYAKKANLKRKFVIQFRLEVCPQIKFASSLRSKYMSDIVHLSLFGGKKRETK